MKIQKAKSSEIFDEYMSKMLKKESQALNVGRAIGDLIPAAGKGTDEAAGVVTDVAKVVPDAVETAGSITHVGKQLDEMESLLKEVGGLTPEIAALITDAKTINSVSEGMITRLLSVKDVLGKKPEEIQAIIDGLRRDVLRNERGKAMFKGKLAAESGRLAKAEEAASGLRQALDDSVAVADAVKVKADAEIARLTSEVARLGGVVSELGSQVAKKDEIIAALTKERDLLKGSIQAVQDVTGQVPTPAQQGKIARLLEVSGIAGFYRAARDKLSSAKKADTPAGRVAQELAEDSTRQADDLASEIISEAPKADPAIRAAKEVAENKGAKEGAKATADAAGEAKPGMLSRMLSAGLAKGSGTSLTGEIVKGGLGLVGKSLKYVMLFAAVGAVGYVMWRTYVRNNTAVVKKEIDTLEMRITDAISKLEALKFKGSLSDGNDTTDTLIDKLRGLLPMLPALYDYQTDDATLKSTFEELEETQEMVNYYLENKAGIQADLQTEDGWPEAIASLEALNDQMGKVKLMVAEAIESGDTAGGTAPEEGQKGGIDQPVGKPDQEPEGWRPSAVPVPVTIYGEEIDIGRTSPGFRSAAPRMIEKIANSPEGLAFIDPENRWGGYLRKSGNNKNDYLRSLYYLYRNQIFNQRQLRRFMRKNLVSAGKKRMSGWKSAIKYYRGKVGRYARASFSENLHKNLHKTANFQESSVQSDNRLGIDMKKQADQTSKEYFQDAVKGLSDQYAKSYYTGLKGMYDQKLGKTEADYNSLYELHSETGAQLVGEAHPLSIEIADAMGRGGVVENVVEQHRHNEGVALSMPSGNFRGKHAWLVQNLVKLADAQDEKGQSNVSDLIDTALQEIVSL
jgi:hypothetical protein